MSPTQQKALRELADDLNDQLPARIVILAAIVDKNESVVCVREYGDPSVYTYNQFPLGSEEAEQLARAAILSVNIAIYWKGILREDGALMRI